jgi:hypothetical protein
MWRTTGTTSIWQIGAHHVVGAGRPHLITVINQGHVISDGNTAMLAWWFSIPDFLEPACRGVATLSQ